MSKRIYQRLIVFVLAGLALPLIPAGAQAGLRATMSSLPSCPDVTQTPYFGHASFSALWRRTDQLVACVHEARAWYWGPQVSGPIYEQLGDKTRLVQYFEKSRMEINDLSRPDQVTNGLLTVELVSGQMQVSPSSYETHPPADIPLASDPDDKNAPQYLSFVRLANTPLGDHPAPRATGQMVDLRVNKAGQTSKDTSFDKYGVKYGFYNTETKHNIADKIWDFLNTTGPYSNPDGTQAANPNGTPATAKLSDPWFYTTGYPISEPYWATVKIGKPTDVLIQLFERRVVTYNPNQTPGFRVEMNNIGQHYVKWRYPKGVPGQTLVYRTEDRFGNVCVDTQPMSCSPKNADSSDGLICRNSPPCLAVSVYSTAYYEHRLQANNSIISARTPANKFKLLRGSELYLKNKTDLNLLETFVLALGSAIFDHKNAEGEIVVEKGNTVIEPLSDQQQGTPLAQSPPTNTKFSVQSRSDNSVIVAVVQGSLGVRSTAAGVQPQQLGVKQQLSVSTQGAISTPQPLTQETEDFWNKYAGGVNSPDIDKGPPTPTPTPFTGGHIIFVSEGVKNYDIWRMKGDGTELTQLTQDGNQDYAPVYSPDGSMFAFSSERMDNDLEIYVKKADGTVERLTTSPGRGDEPSWSPDGKSIMFSSERGGAGSDLFVMKADGTGQTRITSAAGNDSRPSWGTNGRIVFDSDRSGTRQIYTMRPDGSDLRGPLTSAGNNNQPRWNGAANRIVFVSNRDGLSEIYTMGPGGEEAVRVTNSAAGVGNLDPNFSPDGGRIVFASTRDTASTTKKQEIYTIGITGQDLKRLTNLPGHDGQPSWSSR
ncbi:MAG TPA: hypothetical protein VGE04_08275 [Chloroflexia bacterium]